MSNPSALRPLGAALLLVLLCLTRTAPASAGTPLVVTTPRGAPIEVLIERPPGAGPFPVVVLGSGSSYHMRLPILEKVARRLVQSGIGVYRFNWAYFLQDPLNGKQSDDRAAELEDMRTVIELARGTRWVNKEKLFVGGKSLGSIIAWRTFRADPTLKGALLLTPVCSKPLPETNYQGLLAEQRPTQWILGEQDPVCQAQTFYRFLAGAPRAQRAALLPGNHSFERSATPEKVPSAATRRVIDLVAALSADFVVSTVAGDTP